ncbi:erythroid membrane-associated protein [Corythoichthys intestinalis]|uniref:erythroid membrane-associated protein n=1 Tax=Corythoichthys intestinalis TaxID=161448 RepID=UPI0025A65C7D|nr:erythroid membrane-associated protein [Corythoichthys intestinalis]XP_061807829.1 erythroid membrane-associated protein-like [Nerophis lumbriciformis]
MMKECLQFLIEPAKKLKNRLKESRKRVKLEKKEPLLLESQLFIMELARELGKICQRSNILQHIWAGEDVWPAALCRDFIVEWAAVLEKKVQPKINLSDDQYHKPEKLDWRGHLLCILEAGGECEMGPHKRIIMDWTREMKNRPQASIWPGEPVLMMLDDLEFQWKRGHLPNLLLAVELVILAVLNSDRPVKEDVTKEWLVRKQRNQNIDAVHYIPHGVWNWICEASEDVTLDPESANPELLISVDEKSMRCGPERRDVPCADGRFDGWWCAAGRRGFVSGRHYWEVEVGRRDWRLGVAKASAVRRGFRSLNTDSGYLTLRLERGKDLKALTVPVTLLPQSLAPTKVGIYLDYEQGQLSFYDVDKRSHVYTFNDKFTEELVPVFGTVEVLKDLAIRPAGIKQRCLCPGPCLWN